MRMNPILNIQLILVVLHVCMSLYCHCVDCTLESERKFAEIARFVLDDEGPEVTRNDVSRAIIGAANLIDELSHVELCIHDRNWKDFHLIEQVINRSSECGPNVVNLRRCLKSLGNTVRMLPILNNIRDQMLDKCENYIPKRVANTFKFSVNIDWIELEKILHERNLDLEVMLNLRSQDLESELRRQLYEAFLVFLKTLEPIRKNANQSWVSLRIDITKRYNSLISGICKMNGFLNLNLMLNIWQLDGQFFKRLNDQSRQVIERSLVCDIVVDYDISDVIDSIIAINYNSKELYDIIFALDAYTLEPNSVDHLLRILARYEQLTGMLSSRKQDIYIQTAKSNLLPNSDECNLNQVTEFEPYLESVTNIAIYKRHFIMNYLDSCAIKMNTLVLELTQKSSLKIFNVFVQQLSDSITGDSLSQVSLINQQTRINAIAKVLNNLKLKLKPNLVINLSEALGELNKGLEFIHDMCSYARDQLEPALSLYNSLFSELHQYWHSYLSAVLNEKTTSTVVGIEVCQDLRHQGIEAEPLHAAIISNETSRKGHRASSSRQNIH